MFKIAKIKRTFVIIVSSLVGLFHNQLSIEAQSRTKLEIAQLTTALARFPLALATGHQNTFKTKTVAILGIVRNLNSLINQGLALYQHSDESWSAYVSPIYDSLNFLENCKDLISTNSKESLPQEDGSNAQQTSSSSNVLEDATMVENFQKNIHSLLRLLYAFSESASSVSIALKNNDSIAHQKIRINSKIALSMVQSLQFLLEHENKKWNRAQRIAFISLVLVNFGCILKDLFATKNIKPKMNNSANNPYNILGVQQNASERDIKVAYRKLAKELHPDKNKAPNAEEQFKKLTAAYEILCDQEKRANLDQFLASNDGNDFNFDLYNN